MFHNRWMCRWFGGDWQLMRSVHLFRIDSWGLRYCMLSINVYFYSFNSGWSRGVLSPIHKEIGYLNRNRYWRNIFDSYSLNDHWVDLYLWLWNKSIHWRAKIRWMSVLLESSRFYGWSEEEWRGKRTNRSNVVSRTRKFLMTPWNSRIYANIYGKI